MRFFAHDGTTLHGPASVAELVSLPGFDGNTLVCPVGSDNSADWKPALSYRPFREALLAAKTKPPSAETRCPACDHLNPPSARFCNSCGARMDAAAQAASPPAPAEPAKIEAPAVDPEPKPSAPTAIAPPEELGPVIATPEPQAPLLSATPPPGPSPTVSGSTKVLWSSLLLILTAAALAFVYWPRAKRPLPANATQEGSATVAPAAPPATAPPSSVSAQNDAAPISASGTAAADIPIPRAQPAPSSPPQIAEKPAPRVASRKGKRRAKKTRPANDSALIETVAKEASAPAPAPAAPQAPADGEMLLPGVPRRVGKAAVAPKVDAVIPETPRTETTTPPAPAPTSAKTEDLTTRQVREQFEFCVQLLSQAAYEDHFETCLCADARQAAPYRGRKSVYAAALKKRASLGKLETSAAVSSIAVNDTQATIFANWKSSSLGRARKVNESWRLEDGLWCRAP